MNQSTANQADSGAIEPSINHFGVDEEGHRIQEDERIANQTVASDLTAVVFRVHVNDTNNETPVTKTIHSFLTDHENLVNVSRMDEGSVAELQRDQSNLLSVTVSQNDVHEPQHNPLGSDAKPAERNSSENKVEHANNDFVSSTRPNRAEIASSIVPLEIRSPGSKNDDYLHGVQVDDEDLSNVVEHENELIDGSNVDKSRRENSIRFTTVSIRETIVTEVKPIEQKNVEDIRAISFQVPAIDKEAEDADKRQQDNEHPRNVMESRKDQSRPMNNLLLAGGKSTKAFYEIKPSIKTEMEPDQLNPSSTQRPLPGRKFVLPSVDSAFGKFGPYFEDGDQEINITARIGSTMLLDCKIGMLGNKEVTWVQQPSKDSFRLLTVGRILYSADQRISLNFRYPSNWRLQIQYATTRDSGLYKCQVATHPPLVKTINVVVTVGFDRGRKRTREGKKLDRVGRMVLSFRATFETKKGT